MFYWLIPLSIGVVFFVLFLFFRVREKRKIAVVFKGLTSLMFINTAIVAWLNSNHLDNLFGLYVVLGLFFGLLGDVFLDLKFMSEKHETMYTVLGFATFGIGHIFYLTGLLTKFFDFSKSPLFIIVPVIISIFLVGVSLLLEKFTQIKYKKMKPCVILYGFMLFFVTTMYFSANIQLGWTNLTVLIFALSLVLFTLSDLILNNTYFAPGFSTPIFIITNHIFYYIAQFAIAVSLFYLL